MFYVNWGRLLVHKRESYFMLSSWGWQLVSNILAPASQMPGSAGEQLDQDVNSVHQSTEQLAAGQLSCRSAGECEASSRKVQTSPGSSAGAAVTLIQSLWMTLCTGLLRSPGRGGGWWPPGTLPRGSWCSMQGRLWRARVPGDYIIHPYCKQ